MNPKKKREIIGKYDSTAHFYDNRYSNIQREKFNIMFADFSLEDKFLLDAGCGTGLFHDFLLEHLLLNSEKQYRLLGVDISWNMLNTFLMKLKTNEKLVKNHVSLVLSDLENLPFREDVFHAIISLTSLQNLPNIYNGIEESFRVTRNNGDVRFSILKKTLDLDEVLSHLRLQAKNLELVENDDIEDIILSFTLHKKKQ
jgi:ubiquinone/menaquinone biosynthesis C-methylase UbiE